MYRLTSFTGTSFTARASVTNTSTKIFDVRAPISERLGTFKFNIRQIAHDNASFTSTSFDTDTFLNTDITTANKTFNFDIRAGNINAHIISHFVLKEGVIRTLTSNISIVGEIIKTLTVRVGLLQTVSNILRNKFNVNQQMSNTFSSIFGIRNTVGILGNYNDESFTTNSYTISDLSKRINFIIREDVSETSIGRFDLRGAITDTLSNLFDIRQSVSDTITTRFDIRQAILKLSNLEFDSLNRVISTLTNRFRITTTVAVKTLTHQFIIRQKISDVLAGRFDLRVAITRLGTKRFDVRSIILGLPSFVATGFTTASFTLTTGAIPMLTSRFTIVSDVASSYRTFTFHIREAVSDTVTTRFDLRHLISDILSINLKEMLFKTLTHQFIIRQKASDDLTVRFNLRQAIVNTLTSASYLTGTVANILTSKFHIKFFMTNTRKVGTTDSSKNVRSM